MLLDYANIRQSRRTVFRMLEMILLQNDSSLEVGDSAGLDLFYRYPIRIFLEYTKDSDVGRILGLFSRTMNEIRKTRDIFKK